MRFCYINQNVPETTTNLLRASCEKRGIEFIEVYAPGFLFDPDSQLLPGDMLYRAAVSVPAMRVEQFLFAEHVATFHTDHQGVFFGYSSAQMLFQRASLPIPRTFPIASSNREIIRAHVDSLGGFPVIVKLGGSGGIGTMLIDSLPALFSLVDLLCAQNQYPILRAFVDRAVHWRIIVIGDAVVASYRNLPEADDFRTYASEDKNDFISPPVAAAKVAVDAVKALRLEFGGVDVLEHPSGRVYLLEANFPCYFAQPQVVAEIDVAGMMVDYLRAKSYSLTKGRSLT